MLNNFAKRLNLLLEITLKGREEKSEDVAKSVSQYIELIMVYIKGISLGTKTSILNGKYTCSIYQISASDDKRPNLRKHSPSVTLTSSTCMSFCGNDALVVRRKRNIWSLVNDKRHQSIGVNDAPDTSRFIENILNDDNLRFRDKLKAVKQRIKRSTRKLPSQEGTIPYGWVRIFL